MVEFILLMIVLDLIMKIAVEKQEVEEPKELERKPIMKAYTLGNSAEWEFESLDDAMDFRDMRVSGWKGDIKDFYEWKGE